jgi:hypothetical protein
MVGEAFRTIRTDKGRDDERDHEGTSHRGKVDSGRRVAFVDNPLISPIAVQDAKAEFAGSTILHGPPQGASSFSLPGQRLKDGRAMMNENVGGSMSKDGKRVPFSLCAQRACDGEESP